MEMWQDRQNDWRCVIDKPGGIVYTIRTMKSEIKWLKRELPAWEAEGLLAPGAGEKLLARYDNPSAGLAWGYIIFGALGALLIGAGIIALFAANWDTLSPAVKLTAGFTPLLAAGAFAFWTQSTRRLGAAWQEPLGIFWGLSIGLIISITAQVYQISGSAESFTLTWTLLLLPILYITQAVAPTVCYFIGLLIWACVMDYAEVPKMLYWPLALLAFPQLWRKSKGDSFAWHLLLWATIIAMLPAVGVTLEKYHAGLWLIVYTGLFAFITLLAPPIEKEKAFWLNPFNLTGYIGLAFMLWLMCLSTWAWEELGDNRSSSNLYHARWAIFDILVACGVLLVAATGLVRKVIRQRRAVDIVTGASVFLVGGLWTLVSYIHADDLAMWIMSCYLAVYGLVFIVNGLRERCLRQVNGGTIAVLAVILTRFFNDDIGYTVKGIVFIICGVAFLSVNLILARRFKQ